MLITGSNLKKSFSERILFEGASFHVDDNDKIGFVGSNGVGKTTLFKILIGLETYDGDLYKTKQLKIGYLDQYSCADSKKSVFDEVLEVYARLIEMEHELEDIRLNMELGTGDLDALIERQNKINEYLADNDGYFYRNKVKSTLIGLGFTEGELHTSVENLSGGQKTRVELAKILLSDSNLLLLDEPTNHLDITSVEWLEEFLKAYKGAFIVISHDRYFLDRVTNKTFEISGSKLYSFNGNYSAYTKQREIDRLTKAREHSNTLKEISRLEAVIKQQRQWNREKNIKTAESKQKIVDKLKDSLVQPEQSTEDINFSFKAYEGGGNDVIDAASVSKSFDKDVLTDVSLHAVKGEKIFLLGPNGCGKTTLLKILMGELLPDCGQVKLGADIHIGYYDQTQSGLSTDKTVIEEVWDAYPHMTHTQIRNALAVFLFKGDDVFKDIKTLSGGERARVLLTKLMLKKVNLLIMDEPTNHLDINSREALENALLSYGGTMIMVSHDRYFINKLADRVVYLSDNGVYNTIGGYDDFLEKYPQLKNSEESSSPSSSKEPANDYKARKARESSKRKAVNKASRLEEQIAALENENEEINIKLSNPVIATDYIQAAELTEKVQSNEDRISVLLEEWESIINDIENDIF